jgi:transcription elongation factor GreB
MSRTRPIRPASSPYITPQGYAALESELKQLWQRRAHVTGALATAAAEGDRSENAEYIYRKKELRELDRRLGYLQRRIPRLKVVCATEDVSRVRFGAWISLEDHDGRQVRYRIVGTDELDAGAGYISVDSPLARALIGRAAGEETTLEIAGRPITWFILDIRYEEG